MFGRRKHDDGDEHSVPAQGLVPPPVRGPVDAAGEELRNLAVVEAMRNVSVHDTPETRAMLFQILLDSTLVVATPPTSKPPGSSVTKAGESLSIVMAQGNDGAPVLPVFTSVATLLVWRGEETAYAALPALALFQMASAGDGGTIAIDLASPTHGYLTRREFEALAHGRLPVAAFTEVVAEPTEVRIGIPARPPPTEVLDALRASLAADSGIDGAWLYLMQQGENEPELVVGIRFAAAVDIDAEVVQASMRHLVDDVAARSEAARSLLFAQADAQLVASLAGGSGIDLFAL